MVFNINHQIDGGGEAAPYVSPDPLAVAQEEYSNAVWYINETTSNLNNLGPNATLNQTIKALESATDAQNWLIDATNKLISALNASTPSPPPTTSITPIVPVSPTDTKTNDGSLPVSPTNPISPPPPPPPPPPVVIKTATPDIIQFDDETIPETVAIDLLFEEIGGQELLTLSRHDTVNGQDILYQPIKNLNILQQEYNPNNLIKNQQTLDKYLENFPIKLFEKIPQEGSGENGSNVYRNNDGAIVLEFINIEPDEQIEIQFITNGTIYEANI